MKRCSYLIFTLILLLHFGYSHASPVEQDSELLGKPLTLSVDHSIQLLSSGCYRIDVPPLNDAYEQRVVELVNQYRASPGYNLPPLKRTTNLDFAARYQADDMATDNYFSHDTYDGYGGTQFVCDTWTRLRQFVSDFGWAGENIAAGYSSPESVMNDWLNSQGHHDNIVNPNYTEIGVGYYTGGSYRYYWVQDFDSRSGVSPLIINGEAATTNSQQVNL